MGRLVERALGHPVGDVAIRHAGSISTPVMSVANGEATLRDPPTDTAVWLADRIAGARSLLDGLTASQRFHARLIAHELGHQYDADRRSVHELITEPARGRRAEVREVVRRHLVAAEANGRIVVTIGNLLAAEHADASRTCDEIEAATAGFEDEDLRAVAPLLRNAVSLLAGAVLGALELRVLAESLDHTDRAALLAHDRDRWAELTARVSAAVLTGSFELDGVPEDGRSDGASPAWCSREPLPQGRRAAIADGRRVLQPASGRVVLALAAGSDARARLTTVIEQTGASAVIVHTRAAALELLKWLRVDAIVTAIERRSDTLLHLPHSLDRASAVRPLCIALLLPAAAAATTVAVSFGYDAAVPLAMSEGDTFAEMLGAAIDARRVPTAIR